MWTVQDAKAKLSRILQQAKQGEPQIIGLHDPCVVLSLAHFNRLNSQAGISHPGQWLVEHFPRETGLEMPSRTESRPDPFAAP